MPISQLSGSDAAGGAGGVTAACCDVAGTRDAALADCEDAPVSPYCGASSLSVAVAATAGAWAAGAGAGAASAGAGASGAGDVSAAWSSPATVMGSAAGAGAASAGALSPATVIGSAAGAAVNSVPEGDRAAICLMATGSPRPAAFSYHDCAMARSNATPWPPAYMLARLRMASGKFWSAASWYQ